MITDEQLRSLADTLRDTKQSVNYLAAKMLRLRDFTEDLWVRLEKTCGIFRCDACRTWKSVDERVADDVDQCGECSK